MEELVAKLRVVLPVRSRLTTAAKAIKGVLLRPVPNIDRWGLYLPAAVVIFCYAYGRLFIVYPGYSIAALGFAAVVMTARADSFKPAERVIWVVIAAVLMIAEVRILYTDRVTAAKQQAVERNEAELRFENSVQGFRDVLRQEDILLRNIVETNKIAQTNLNNITGGRTFIVLSPIGDSTWVAFSKGGSMLHSVTVEITDMDSAGEYIKQHPRDVNYFDIPRIRISLGEFPPTLAREFNIGLPQKKTTRLSMNFFAMNGGWQERYASREINGKRKIAISVIRQAGPINKTIYTSITKGFPLDKQGRPIDEKGSPMW